MANLSSHGVLLVAAGSILWGSSGIAGQYILQGQGISPEWLTFFRLFVAGSLLLLISHLMGKDIVSVWKSSAERLRLIIFGCLGMLGTQYCYFACIKVSNAAAATVLEYIMPVLIIMWYCMREKRLPRGKEVFCAVFAIVGTVLIATAGDLTSLALPPEALRALHDFPGRPHPEIQRARRRRLGHVPRIPCPHARDAYDHLHRRRRYEHASGICLRRRFRYHPILRLLPGRRCLRLSVKRKHHLGARTSFLRHLFFPPLQHDIWHVRTDRHGTHHHRDRRCWHQVEL